MMIADVNPFTTVVDYTVFKGRESRSKTDSTALTQLGKRD
jgi:hypothetical protein